MELELTEENVAEQIEQGLAEQVKHCPGCHRGPVARFKLKINGHEVEVEAPMATLRRIGRRAIVKS